MPNNEQELAILKDKKGNQIALQGVKARARLHGLLAEIEVEQSYQNPQKTNIEAVYTFPLPFGAVLLGLDVEIAGRKLTGQVVEKKAAERRYEDAVTDGDSAVMLEEVGPGLYTASLGNLMAGESAVIRYRYGVLLHWQGDRLRFLLPTTIAPRYGDAEAAGLQPHQAPESSLGVEYPFDLVVDIEGDLATAAIASPSHPIAMERTDAGLRIHLDKKAFLDRDFVLTLASDKIQSSCVVVPDGEGSVAMASLRIPLVADRERQPMALKLVIDCSGSMGGTSIAQARKAGRAILDQLRPGDSFNVTLFGSQYEHLFPTMVPASARYITEAWNRIDRMDADLGGTEMETALNAVFALGGKGADGTVLLVTDGEIHEHQKLIKRAEKSGQRVFVVGVGTAVAETFLRKLANVTHGACELVAPQEGMAEFVLTQFHRMRQARVGKLRIDWPLTPQWQTPLPETVFAGDTLHVFGGFDQAPEGNVSLAWEAGSALNVPMSGGSDPQVPRIAAARRLEHLPEPAARSVAITHQLLSPWTNFLVIAERADKAVALPELHKVPQMLAAGWGACGSVVGHSECMAELDDFFTPDLSARSAMAQSMSGAIVDKYDIPAFLRRLPSRDSSTPAGSKSSPPQFSKRAPGVADPVARLGVRFMRKDADIEDDSGEADSSFYPILFIGRMEMALQDDLRLPSLPGRLEQIISWGIDDEVVEGLRMLIKLGYDEAQVIAAFVNALADSSVGNYFDRAIRRAILKAWKQAAVADELDRAMQGALAGVEGNRWAWNGAALDPLRLASVVI